MIKTNRRKILVILLVGAVLNGGFYASQKMYFQKQGANIYLTNNERIISIQRVSNKIIRSPIGSVTFKIQILNNFKFDVPEKITELWTEKFYRDYTKTTETRLVMHEIKSYLESIRLDVVKDPIDARFEFLENNMQVLIPSENGYNLNISESLNGVAKQLIANKNDLNLVIDIIEPQITLSKMNNLGINTLLAKGVSDFSGSSSARIHNIEIGASKYHGLLIKPGKEFSFNDMLGEVNAQSGYEHELVIKKNKLIPEYGGGICQVSTTMFRTAINSGLPIIERQAHSLPVRYYNPQGFDATIYPGVVDLKFINDTPSNILIQIKIEDLNLIISFYGSDDNRKVEIVGPTVYDEQSDGSLKTVLSRTISMPDGSIKKDSFYSNYKSPDLFEIERNPLE